MRLLLFMIATAAAAGGVLSLAYAIWAAFTEQFTLVCINGATFLVCFGIITLCSNLMEMIP